MNCPACQSAALVMSERQGIEIDYCPQCRGVWLDRGELDKIIDRSVGASPGRDAERESRDSRESRESRDYSSRPGHSQGHHDSHQGGHYKKKKREGFLSDLFDFD
jgi:hypothetical protein